MESNQVLSESKIQFPIAKGITKHFAGAIDAVLIILLWIGLYYFFLSFQFSKQVNWDLDLITAFFLLITYRIVTIFLNNGTIGMQLLHLRYVSSPDHLLLTTKEKFLAACMIYINNIEVYNTKMKVNQ